MNKKTTGIIAAYFVLLLTQENNAYANLVFPAIANQFAVAFVVGFTWSIVIALAILTVEAFFIKKLPSMNFFFAFYNSFLINLGSSLAGMALLGISFSGGKNVFAYGDMKFGTYLGMIPGYVLTVLLEGVLLLACGATLKRRVRGFDCFKVSAAMNFCSYLILLASVMIADIVSKGQNFHPG